MVFSCVKYWKDYTQSVVKDGSMVFAWWSNSQNLNLKCNFFEKERKKL